MPSCDIVKVWNEIIEPIVPDADDSDTDVKKITMLVAYSEKTWMGTPKYHSKDMRLPIFSHNNWSIFDAVKDCY